MRSTEMQMADGSYDDGFGPKETDEELFARARAHMEKYWAAASLDRRLWDATVRLVLKGQECSSGPVEPGWKLVPIEPTELMTQALGSAYAYHVIGKAPAKDQGQLHERVAAAYRAALEKAPALNATPQRPGYLGDINGPGCDPDVP